MARKVKLASSSTNAAREPVTATFKAKRKAAVASPDPIDPVDSFDGADIIDPPASPAVDTNELFALLSSVANTLDGMRENNQSGNKAQQTKAQAVNVKATRLQELSTDIGIELQRIDANLQRLRTKALDLGILNDIIPDGDSEAVESESPTRSSLGALHHDYSKLVGLANVLDYLTEHFMSL